MNPQEIAALLIAILATSLVGSFIDSHSAEARRLYRFKKGGRP